MPPLSGAVTVRHHKTPAQTRRQAICDLSGCGRFASHEPPPLRNRRLEVRRSFFSREIFGLFRFVPEEEWDQVVRIGLSPDPDRVGVRFEFGLDLVRDTAAAVSGELVGEA